MAKKIQDDDGNTYVAVKPWYKKWWVWVIIAVLVVLGFALLGGSDDSDTKSSSSSATAHKTTKKETGTGTNSDSDTSSLKTIEVSYTDYKVAAEKTFSVNYSNTSWNAANVKIDKVTVYKLSKPYKYESANDGKFNVNGFVRFHVSITANRDVSIYPTQGTAVYSNGEQHEADSSESWDGDISKGATKSGNVTVPVKDLSNTSSLKTLRFKFDGNYDTDDYDDDNSNKTFDITLNLN